MNAARRSARRRGWPRGLDEPRPGYFTFRKPGGDTTAIGRVPLAVAINEAIAANRYLAEKQPGLVEKIEGTHTIADVLDKMPAAKATNTARSWRSLDKQIREALGAKPCDQLTVSDCAEFLEGVAEEGKARSAQALRSRLIAVCKRGMRLGWMDGNPAEVTGEPEVVVKRGRLTLETFRQIYAVAHEVAEWLPHAMMLALVTGADRSTIAGLQRSDVSGGYLTITRSKTGARIAIPLALRLNCVGVSLADLAGRRTGVLSKYLVHHVNPWGNAPAGSAVHVNNYSRAFTEARKLAGLPDKGAPTFHELRSLCKRLYEEQGNVDTKALLGHATERMSELYADPRGVEAIKVRIG